MRVYNGMAAMLMATLLGASPVMAQATHDAKGTGTAGHDMKAGSMKGHDMAGQGMAMSEADKAKMMRCHAMTAADAGKDAECAALMKAHSGMMHKSPGKTM